MAIPELESRLLEVVDWVQAVDELQAWADDETHDRAARSQAWSRVAGASADLLLDEARALDASQRAFKLDQRNLGALSQARRLYRRRGHIAMAIKLGGLELRLEHDPRRQASLRVELGRALLDQGSLDQTVSILTLVAEAGETIEAGEAARGLLDQVRAAHEGGERALSTLQDELGSLADLEGAGSSVS
ncbi:MAG: hypothetical protein KDK70_34050, partial [Myxococcales bacterium]|nr:hypothetical protein [Myxococcales bacterium]